MSTDNSETDFERDVKQIVMDTLKEQLPKLLKSEENKEISKNSRGPIETAPMVVIPEGFDPELLDVWAYTAAQEGKWVALVYNMMAEIPRISDSLANGKDVRTVSRAHGQQSITFKSGGKILWLAKDLKGGRGVSVNLVLRVEGRGEGMALNMANEERLLRRQAPSTREMLLRLLDHKVPIHRGELRGRLYDLFHVAVNQTEIVTTLSTLIHQGLVKSSGGDGYILTTAPPDDDRTLAQSDQNWHNILHVLPTGAKEAMTTSRVIREVHALGGVIYPNNVYIDALHRMASEGKINRRFSGQWLYYRDA